jgi:hypothetical protein
VKARRRRLKRNREAHALEQKQFQHRVIPNKKKDWVPEIEVPQKCGLDLVFIPPHEVEEIWPLAEDFIKAGCSYGELIPEELKKDCASGWAQLWIGWSDRCEAAAVTRIMYTPNGPVCQYDSMSAKSLRRSNKELAPKIEQWAKSQGCIAVRIYGRRGWSRAMPDYTLKWVCMDKEL